LEHQSAISLLGQNSQFPNFEKHFVVALPYPKQQIDPGPSLSHNATKKLLTIDSPNACKRRATIFYFNFWAQGHTSHDDATSSSILKIVV
jgi:hypothetical protein